MPDRSKPKTNQRNYYRILHVQPDAPVEIIHSSYRTLMQRLKFHPDLGGEEWNAALINTAYAVLSDPIKREKYDREFYGTPKQFRSKNKASDKTSPEPAQRPEPQPDIFQCLFCHEPHFFGSNIPVDALCRRCQSPLCQGEKHQLNKTKGRRANRVEDTKQINFYTNWPAETSHSAIIQNISIGGARFLSAQELKKDTYLKIEAEHFSAIGRIVNCRQLFKFGGQWQVNIAFITLQFKEKRGSFISLKI